MKYNGLNIEHNHGKNKGLKQKHLILNFTREFNFRTPIKSSKF